MRLRNTLIAMILLAGLAGFIYYYEYKGEEQRQSADEATKNLVAFERDKITGIEISRPAAGLLTLRKESDGWTVASPQIAAPTRADQEKVDSLLSAVSFLRVDQKMEGIAATELEGFKLKDPAVRVNLQQADGKPPLSISLGDKVPVGGNYYAMRGGSPDVLVVTGGVDSILSSDLSTLRYRKIVGVDAWKVTRFSIEKADKVITLKHGAGPGEQDWKMERPVSFPADTTKAQGLWFDLQSAEADSFESEAPTAADLDRFGLAHPALTLTVEPAGEAKQGAGPVKVTFGGGGQGAACYARRSDMTAVMKVKQELVDKLDKAVTNIDDLRDARVAPFDRFKLSSMEIHANGVTASLMKGEDSKWRWGAREGPEMPSDQVNALLDAIEGARATGYLDSAAPAVAGDAALALTLHEGSGESASSTTVRVDPEGSSPGAGRRVTSSLTTTVYIVPPSAVLTLVERASGLKEPRPPQDQQPAPAPVPSAGEGEKKEEPR